MTVLDKQKCFEELLCTVYNCNLCERMCERKKVLSNFNGNLNSKVLFLAEAPGRLGAECTGIPLYGDKTGNNFELLLGNIGWRREDVFISNAILCNPQDDNGNNATPTAEEILNCSNYLEMLISLINPDVIVTLGVKALEALKIIENHNYVLKNVVAQPLNWYGKKLFPLYHMGPRATIHRSIVQQRADFIRLMHFVDPLNGLKHQNKIKNKEKLKSSNGAFNVKLKDMIYFILTILKEVSFFKLTKLLYLTDLNFLEENDRTISGCIYLRMQEGPWIPTLRDTVNDMRCGGVSICYIGKKPIVKILNTTLYEISLTDEEKNAIIKICNKYKSFDDGQIKTAAYLTKPMKYVIKEEKKGRNMTKMPVLYKNSTVMDSD